MSSRLNTPRGANYEECLADGTVISGLPLAARAALERQARRLGVNYLLTCLFLGTMSLDDALRSLDLFAGEVMSHLVRL